MCQEVRRRTSFWFTMDSLTVLDGSMASFLAPYGNETALVVARDLDAKIESLLETATR